MTKNERESSSSSTPVPMYKFANINNMMQQQHDDLQAYFRFQGFNPYQGP
uniref:Uncharacterized protein n=1 Tax=Oryza sativa subsp. japonica TaxID=39947 RepID=Q2QQJ1_ORYSJ|nr:hypothetical protein LOC_Os12g30860 [Oryza sativa Japonica Group]